MNYPLLALGAWIVFDGVASIVFYWHQSPQEHAVRVIRIIAGLAVIYFGK